ncbi:MAG TPA: hypothetical protein DCS82_02020 [Rhodospirillaceae bacterium]|nr:hypothetical protein [Rhodospirillaceae bacterium]HAT34468.1 hypothetical protein [Rhodospirillaceae bacterium]|tara:strand:- start:737 stop:919 length:183 start_codon:yes stop_codon:yes gene_type:complete
MISGVDSGVLRISTELSTLIVDIFRALEFEMTVDLVNLAHTDFYRERNPAEVRFKMRERP